MSEVPKIVHDRLRASLPEGGASAHPDADLLTAFAEQALSAEERERVLQHLARCGDCREVIALALPAEEAEPVSPVVDEAPVAVRSKSESGWFAWPRLRWVALAAGVVVAGAILLMHPGKPSAPSQAKQQPQSPVAEPIGTVAAKPAAPARANSEVASSKEMDRAQPSRESDRDEALSVANARKAPAPVMPDEGGLRTRAAAGQRADAARGASFGLPQTAQNKLAERRMAAGRDKGATTRDYPAVPATVDSETAVVAGMKQEPLALGGRLEKKSELADGKAAPAAPAMAGASLGAVIANQNGNEKKDLLARAAPANGQPQAVPPPRIPMVTETVEVTAAAPAIETSSAEVATARKQVPPVSKAKAPVQNMDVAAPAVKTEESKVADSTISSPVGNLTTSGRNTVTLMQLAQLQALWRNSSGALQRSLDNGANWQTALRADRSLLCNAASANEVWTGGKKGSLFHSSDAGTTWTQVHPSVKGQPLTADVIRIEVRKPAEIVVSTSKRETWTTLDGGKTWDKK